MKINVSELRKTLKGISGDVPISTGNLYYFCTTWKKDKTTLNIMPETPKYTENKKPTKIKRVIIWGDE